MVNYPNLTMEKLIFYTMFKRIRAVSFLEFINYDLKKVKLFTANLIGDL